MHVRCKVFLCSGWECVSVIVLVAVAAVETVRAPSDLCQQKVALGLGGFFPWLGSKVTAAAKCSSITVRMRQQALESFSLYIRFRYVMKCRSHMVSNQLSFFFFFQVFQNKCINLLFPFLDIKCSQRASCCITYTGNHST